MSKEQQTEMQQNDADIVKGLIGSSFDPTKYYILSGCVNTGLGSNYIISEGSIFSGPDNKIYQVDETTFTAGVGETAVGKVTPTLFKDFNYHNAEGTDDWEVTKQDHEVWKIVFSSGVSGSGDVNFGDLKPIPILTGGMFPANTIGPDFTFTDGVPNKGNTYGNWSDLMNVIANEPVERPRITFTTNFTIPAGTWDLRGGTLRAYTSASSFTVVTVQDNVILDNLSTVDFGLMLICTPSTPHDTFTFSGLPPGTPKIIICSLGAVILNLGSHPLLTINAGEFGVFGGFGDSQGSFGPLTAPIIRGIAGSTIIASLISTGVGGGLQDNWLDGDGALTYHLGAEVKDPLPLLVGWIGTISYSYGAKAPNILYNPAIPASWLIPPAQVAQALDELVSRIGSSGLPKIYEASTANGTDIFITNSPFTWNSLLTLNATTTTNSKLNCTGSISWRANVLAGPINPITTSFRITVDGATVVTWSDTAITIAGFVFANTILQKQSSSLSPGLHVVNLEWGTDATATAGYVGTWGNLIPYNIGDVVFYSGAGYIALVPNVGFQPDISPVQWNSVPGFFARQSEINDGGVFLGNGAVLSVQEVLV